MASERASVFGWDSLRLNFHSVRGPHRAKGAEAMINAASVEKLTTETVDLLHELEGICYACRPGVQPHNINPEGILVSLKAPWRAGYNPKFELRDEVAIRRSQIVAYAKANLEILGKLFAQKEPG